MDTKCRICGEYKIYVSSQLGVCLSCIRSKPDESLPYIQNAHSKARNRFDLPLEPPRTEDGIECGLCSNECKIGQGDRGYCGLRWNEEGLKSLGTPNKGLLRAYLDPHPTNCCSAWFCPACTGAGYPRYTYKNGIEYGYNNLAVFLYGCNFDCLYCQNSSHKNLSGIKPVSVEAMANKIIADKSVSCICFFGGSPEPQLPYTFNLSESVLDVIDERIIRICYEWNGCGNPKLVEKAAELALISGGNLKFDLKAHTPSLSRALSGLPNEMAYKNFKTVAKKYYPKRPGNPLLTATTLLVPGYVDAKEVDEIAKFIADQDPDIPYSLLAFHPDHMMMDLPVTPIRQALDCYKAARKHLERVHVGNLHLLGLRRMEDFKKHI